MQKSSRNPQNQKHERLPNHFTEDRAVQGAMQEFPMHLEALYIAEMGFGRLGTWILSLPLEDAAWRKAAKKGLLTFIRHISCFSNILGFKPRAGVSPSVQLHKW